MLCGNKEKNIELIKKLKTLAEQGIGGERDNAKRLLADFMEKYGVEEVDLSDDVLDYHEFVHANPFEEQLLHQLFYKIADGRGIYRRRRGKGAKNTLCLYCTKAEAVQIGVEYDFYRQLWKEEQELFFQAFVQKHRIFKTGPDVKKREILDYEECRRISMMMAGMQDNFLAPMIGSRTIEEK